MKKYMLIEFKNHCLDLQKIEGGQRNICCNMLEYFPSFKFDEEIYVTFNKIKYRHYCY